MVLAKLLADHVSFKIPTLDLSPMNQSKANNRLLLMAD